MRTTLPLLLLAGIGAGALAIGFALREPVPAPFASDSTSWAYSRLAPPGVRWSPAGKVQAEGNHLRLAFKVEAAAPLQSLDIRLSPLSSEKNGESLEETHSITGWPGSSRVVDWDSDIDLSGSYLAGKRVSVQVVATDIDGRTGTSPVLALTLPEKRFTQPLARALSVLRHNLQEDPKGKRGDALRALAGLLQQRQAFENHDLTLLTLRAAAVRIALDDSTEGLQSALKLLWHAAVLFEEDSPSKAHVAVRSRPSGIRDRKPDTDR